MNIKRLLILAGTVLSGLTTVAIWILFPSGLTSLAHAASDTYTVCPAGPPICDYSVIQYAVDAAVDGDVIKVAAGTYDDINNRYGLAQIVYVEKSVTIQGGYTTAFTEPPDPDTNPSILDAKGQGRVIYIEGEIHPTIAGLRITGGEAKDLGSPIGIDAGGGVLIVSASATLKDNYIYENSADSTHNGDGGGVYLLDSDSTLESNTVISNTAQRDGGGVVLNESAATLNGNTISANTAVIGGGIRLEKSDAILDNNIVSSNSALSGGGGHLTGGNATLNNNTIISNTATLYAGGGLFVWECNNATFIGNTISYNSATTIGGGFQLNCNNISVSRNTISHNTAEWGGGIAPGGNTNPIIGNRIFSNTAIYEGGGVWLGDGEINLFGNTIISNTATSGAGLGCSMVCTGTIAGNYFSGNYATADGGGILIGGNPILKNNIIVDNHADNLGSGIMISAGSLSSLLHNTFARNEGSSGVFITGGPVALTNNIIVSHTLGLEVDSGATATIDSTLWGNGVWANGTDWSGGGTINHHNDYWGNPDFVDYLAGDYHIGENSAAIDKGIDAGVTTDIDFHPRPYQLPDLGADEYWPPGALKFIYLPLVIR